MSLFDDEVAAAVKDITEVVRRISDDEILSAEIVYEDILDEEYLDA